MSDVRYVLDASALLAFLHNEPGADVVADCLFEGEVAINAVNYCEVIGKGVAVGKSMATFRDRFEKLHVQVVDFNPQLAWASALMRAQTDAYGLSLADRACLATARHFAAAAVTADGVWRNLAAEYAVKLIR